MHLAHPMLYINDWLIVSAEWWSHVLDTDKERSLAVNQSSPGGKLDQNTKEDAGQTWESQTNSEGVLTEEPVRLVYDFSLLTKPARF